MREFDPNSTVLVIDIGNTNTSCALYEGRRQMHTFQLSSLKDQSAQIYLQQIRAELCDYDLSHLRYASMASVVPHRTELWLALLQNELSLNVYNVTALSPLGLRFPYPNPETIGADLVVNAYAAWKRYACACIIIDLGTATTIQLLNADGFYEAAAIIPGLKTAAANLFEKAALLADIELRVPDKLLGANTEEALLGGIVGGHAIMLEAFIGKIKQLYPEKGNLTTIITGGMSRLLAPEIPSVDIVDPDLTLDGLELAFEALKEAVGY